MPATLPILTQPRIILDLSLLHLRAPIQNKYAAQIVLSVKVAAPRHLIFGLFIAFGDPSHD